MYKIDFFPEVSEEAKCLLLNIARIKEYRRKDYLLREGQVCKRLYFIQSGLLRTFYNNTGKDINLHFATEGQFSTDIKSLRRQIPSELWIQAYEPTTVLEFNAGNLLSLYSRSEEIQDICRRLMAQLDQEYLERTNLIPSPQTTAIPISNTAAPTSSGAYPSPTSPPISASPGKPSAASEIHKKILPLSQIPTTPVKIPQKILPHLSQTNWLSCLL